MEDAFKFYLHYLFLTLFLSFSFFFYGMVTDSSGVGVSGCVVLVCCGERKVKDAEKLHRRTRMTRNLTL